MSIKTLRKRIALVAVSALGVGLLSVAPASAAVAINDIVISTKTDLINAGTCTIDNTAGYGNRVARAVVGSVVTLRRAVGTDATYLSVSGPAVVEFAREYTAGVAGTASATVTATSITDAVAVAGAAETGDEYGFRLTGAGVVTISYGATSAATPVDYITIIGVTSCKNNIFSATYSNVSTINDGTNAVIANANVDANTSATAGTPLYIRLTAKDGYDTAITTGTYIASATNGATVAWSAAKGTTTTAGSLSSASTTDANGDLQLRVDPGQYATTSTTVVTITHNATAVATKTLTFFGEPAKIVVGTVYSGKTSDTDDGTVLFTYQDSAGNTVPGAVASFVAASAGTTITTAASVKAPTSSSAAIAAVNDVIEAKLGGSTTAGVMTYACGSTAGTADFTITTTSTVDANVLTAVVPGKCYGGIYTYTVSLDKASYKVGEVATITIDAKDSKGNPVADSSKLQAASVSVGGGTLTYTLTGNDSSGAVEGFQGGKVSLRAQMTTAGSFNTVVALTGAATSSTTAAYTVTDGNVSNTEVLSAIVKLIASINEQIALLQKQLAKATKKK
jgi:hypothetical protein